jgi:hypothetical protein
MHGKGPDVVKRAGYLPVKKLMVDGILANIPVIYIAADVTSARSQLAQKRYDRMQRISQADHTFNTIIDRLAVQASKSYQGY